MAEVVVHSMPSVFVMETQMPEGILMNTLKIKTKSH